jgi:predicted MFS family arabinose efflux permease
MGKQTRITLPRAFRRLAWSNLAAQLAEQISLAASPLVAVLTFGAGEAATGLLQAAQTLPFLLFSIPAGVWADRMSRARLMSRAELVRVISLLAVLTLMALGNLNLPLLALLGFLGACGTVAFSVAAPALVPNLVQEQALPIANGRIELARTTAFASGPALGGALVGWIGGGPAFAIAALLSACAVILLNAITEPPREPAPRHHPFAELREGAAFVFRHPLLRPIFITQFVFNTALFAIQAVYVPYAVHSLGLSATGVGITLAALGSGMVVGAASAARVMDELRLGIVIAVGPLCGVAAAFAMLLTVWIPSGVLAGLSFFLMGAGPILWVVSTTTLRQVVTPPRLLGRASAINSIAYGARPLGAAIGALVGGALGAQACFALAAAGFMLQATIILASPAVRLKRNPDQPNVRGGAD